MKINPCWKPSGLRPRPSLERTLLVPTLLTVTELFRFVDHSDCKSQMIYRWIRKHNGTYLRGTVRHILPSPIAIFLFLLIYFILFFILLGNRTGFSNYPSKPTIALSGSNVTFTWKYHLSHQDQESLESVVFGEWSRDNNTFIELSVHCRNENMSQYSGNTSSSYSKCLQKTGDSYAVSFHLINVTTKEKKTYGCRLSFGSKRDAVTDSVQLFIAGMEIETFCAKQVSICPCVCWTRIPTSEEYRRTN